MYRGRLRGAAGRRSPDYVGRCQRAQGCCSGVCVCVCECVFVQAGEAGESELYGVRESRVCVCVVCVRADRRGGGICAVWCKRVAGACVCVWWQGALQ